MEVIIIACCSSPLKAVRETCGKVHILDRACFDSYQKSGSLSGWTDAAARKVMVDRYGAPLVFDVPCGRCLNCRLNKSRTWSQRCMLESKSWDYNWFVTLTYDDDHLPFNIDHDSGEVLSATLVPFDVRDFMKRIREYFRDRYGITDIRFYMCGEYGDITARPHYHIILFNCPLDDLRVYSRSDLGDVYYNSNLIDKKWGKGYAVIGELTPQSAAYTARYCLKKAMKSIDYDELGIHEEYVNMSRRPGIALPYLEANLGKIYEYDQIYLPDGEVVKPSRYFDLKAEQMGVDVDKIKKQRILLSNMLNNQKVDLVSRDYYAVLEDLEADAKLRSRMKFRGRC